MRGVSFYRLSIILISCTYCFLGLHAQESSGDGYNKTITLTNFEPVNSSINENCFNKIGREFFLLEIDIEDAKFFPSAMRLSQSVYKTRETIAIDDLKVEEFYYLLNHNFVYTGAVVSYNLRDYIFTATKRHGDGVIKPGQTLQLYTANIEEEYFTNIEKLPFCDKDYNYCHPSISENGNLIVFASDKPGGQGGYDLYASVRVSGKWSKPVNLGPKVNSVDDELYPYYSADGFLYFSSDRFGGAGGNDIYVCERLDNGWTAAANLGAPYNSKSHDYGFRILNYEGYGTLSSDRSGGLGLDDIYTFRHFKESENRDLISAVEKEIVAADDGTEDDSIASLGSNGSTTIINNYFNFQSPEAASVMDNEAMVVFYTAPADFDEASFRSDEIAYTKQLPVSGSQKLKVSELSNLSTSPNQIAQIMIDGYEDIYLSPTALEQPSLDFTFVPQGMKYLPGHVIFSDGQPVENVEVELKAIDGSSSLKATTDQMGKFSSRVFGNKEYEVRLFDNDLQVLETFNFDPAHFDQLVIDMTISKELHDKILEAVNNIPIIEDATSDFDLIDVDHSESIVEETPLEEKKPYAGDDEGDFYVISGTFSSERRAIRRWELMKSVGFDQAQIIIVDGSPYYRVCVGSSTDLDESIARQNKAISTVDDTFIIRKLPDLVETIQ